MPARRISRSLRLKRRMATELHAELVGTGTRNQDTEHQGGPSEQANFWMGTG